MSNGTYLENGVYLPAISESPWGEQVNNNFVLLSNAYKDLQINLQEGLSLKVDKNSDEIQIINSDFKINGNCEFTNVINGTITDSLNSTHSLRADNSDNANHASNADNATYATTAGSSAYALSSDNATQADNATNADHADYATNARCDESGNVIETTYLKISDYAYDPNVLNSTTLNDHITNTNIHTSSEEKNNINNALHNLSTGLNTANNNISENTSDIRNLQLALQNINTSGNYVTLENDQTINGTKTFTELINGNITGNATSADKFSSGKTVSLNGDVTGSAISKDTWNITTTLKNTGAVAGSYGLQSNSTVYGGVIKVPYITVNSKGLITNISETDVALPDAGETDVLVEQKYITYNLNYPLLFSSVSDIASTSSRGAQKAGVSNSLYVNPSTNTIYATTFEGDLTGNADTSSSSNKATNNANDNELSDTIIKGLTISGSTITYTQIDGNTGTITTPNTNTKVTQTVSDNDDTYPVLLCPTANATTNQGAKTSIFASDVKVNPSTGTINANNYLINGNPLAEEYVTIDTNQTITGAKEFTQIIDGDISGNSDTCTEYYLYMVNNSDDLATMLEYKPLTLSDVFDTWYRFAHYQDNGQFNLTNYNGNNTVKADMEAWSYVPETNAIANSRNTGSFVGFISSKKYDRYTLKIKGQAKEGSADDDMFAIICAFMTDSNGVEHTLSLTRSGNRQNAEWYKYRFSLVYDFQNPTEIVLYNGENDPLTNTNWQHPAHIQAQRSGATLICTSSEQDSDDMTLSFTYSIPKTQGTLTAEAYANITRMLSNKSQVGFGMRSQPGNFILENTEGLFDSNDIYYTVTDQIYSYDETNNEYVVTNRKVSDEIKDGSRVFNNVIGKSFYYTEGRGDVIGVTNTANITVPTKTSELTNDSGFITGSYLPLTGGTLTGDLKFQITGYERGNNTSSYNIRMVDLYDDNNTRFGLINTEIASDKSSVTSIYAYKTTVATGSNIGRIAIGCDSSGKVYTVAPTPATDDNSTKIATTAFVKANMSSVSNRVLTAITSTRTTDGTWTFPCTKHARVYIIGSITADYIPQSEIVVWFYSGCYATGSFIYKATEDEDDVVKNIYITNMASANTITVKIEQHNNATFKSISLVAYQ